MSEEAKKYWILDNDTLWNLVDEMNEAVAQGYKLHTFTAMDIQEDEYGRHPQYIAVMSLSSSAKYDDIKYLRDVSPHDVDQLISEGWIVADSYSKFIRMVKKNV